jgi:hypothetical protein
MSQLEKGRASHRFFQDLANGGTWVREQRHRMLPDHVGTHSVRQINGQPLSSVEEVNSHRSSYYTSRLGEDFSFVSGSR